jgi:hypothetical protein
MAAIDTPRRRRLSRRTVVVLIVLALVLVPLVTSLFGDGAPEESAGADQPSAGSDWSIPRPARTSPRDATAPPEARRTERPRARPSNRRPPVDRRPGAALPRSPRDTPPVTDRVTDIEQELSSLEEEIDDLSEPVGEFELFDQCMHLVGVTEYGSPTGASGYEYEGNPSLGVTFLPAFEMDMRGFGEPQYQFLAYPGEEPPSIECNEDAEARPEND